MNRRQFLIASGSAPLLAQTAVPAHELDWVDARKLTVEGLGFKDVKSPYDRLPARAEGVVPAPVWNLSRDSAGALVRFTAATTEIQARWTVTNKNLAGANITAIASSGLDLYARTDAGKWRWLGMSHRVGFNPPPRKPMGGLKPTLQKMAEANGNRTHPGPFRAPHWF